ncbi:hypothetical protein OROGR_003799 [Orobanche gracilis]
MEIQPSPLLSWAYYYQGKSMEELRQKLLYTTVELEQTRATVQDELRKRDDQLLNLKELLNKVIRERDEAQEKCHKLLLENIVSSPVIDHLPQPPPPQLQQTLSETMMIELTPDKPLPEKGKVLQAVMKVGPLLQTLLLTGPLPQWRHPPPPLESFEIPPVTILSPPPPPQLLLQDSFVNNNTNGNSSTSNNCGRESRKRVLCEGSDSPSDNKYQRIVLH